MKLLKIRPRYFWSAESGMTGLLIFIVVYLFVMCALGDFKYGELVARFSLSLIILAGVLTTFKQPWVRFFAIALAASGLTLSWAEEIRPGGSLALVAAAINLSYLGLLLAVLIVQVFQSGSVTAHRIRGAIVVYLLLGGVWGMLYSIVALTIPGAFHFPESFSARDPEALRRLLTYFSFTTLTTTGFGDITPVHPLARTLAIFEALTGQLYLVITLARMVSLAVTHQKEGA